MYEDLKTCLDPLRFEEKRLVYKYPEHNTDNSKTITKLESREIKNKDLDIKLDDSDKSDKRLNIALIIVGFVCVSIVIVGLVFILIASMDKTKDVSVPNNLEGLTESEACKKIEKVDLICKVKYAYDEEFEEDVVMSVSPKSSSKLKTGNIVTITVSSFEETIEVEDYKGKKLDVIKAELESLGIRVVPTPEKVTEDDDIEENTIISQNIEVGKRLHKKNGVIELVYATLITVYPDFTDGTYTRDLIQQFCDDNNIKCIFKTEEDNNYEEGAIILQSRDVGDEVKSNTNLTITIATNSKETNNELEEGTETE